MKKRYELMLAEKANCKISMMSRALKVSRSGFYSWLNRETVSDPWADLRTRIERLWLDSDKALGTRSIFDLIDEDEDFSGTTLYRVRECMREMGIFGIQKNSSKRTTVADPNAPVRPDPIKRDFTSPAPTIKPVGGIAYLRTGQGRLYLAAVIDLCTRMAVGWPIADHMEASLRVSALEMAYARGYVADGACFHSDRGSQYTSLEYARYATSIGVRLSVGRTGSCHDNAVAESFFSRLKNERCSRCSYKARAEAKTAVVGYIEGFYNRRRPHSAIEGKIPAEVMDAFFERTKPITCEELVGYLAA